MLRLKLSTTFILAAIILSLGASAEAQDGDPPEVVVGERLFLETRFAQFFFTNCSGNVNTNLPAGDPVLETTATIGAALPGPFAGQSMSCRACHLVDEQPGRRTYNDFARRSPIPDRGDGQHTTTRNSPGLLGVRAFHNGAPLLHTDGEFVNTRALVKATFTGRNFGWLPQERDTAIAHLARVIREDDGMGALAQEFGGCYPAVLSGVDTNVPAEFRLPPRFRVNVLRASDEQIVDTISRLVAAYVDQLQFAREKRRFLASPFDLFVRTNGLPTVPAGGESSAEFSARLLRSLERLSLPQFITTNDGTFVSHDQPFEFGPEEMAGLKIFLRREPVAGMQSGAGNCAACHAPPRFTDLSFHNTGATQEEYDELHGAGSFAALFIPSLETRGTNSKAWLPATAQYPDAVGPFRRVPSAGQPGFTDLGVWNIFANPEQRGAQPYLRRILREPHENNRAAALLERSVARFKTPSLRDLGHSAPYLHAGSKDTVEDVLQFYAGTSELARAGALRNADPEIERIRLSGDDVPPLAAFLRSLNEDYE
jgi:cytochrome c peroxidase